MGKVFWSRGSPANAASGCKGMFYANLVLTAESITQIKAARESIGLPEVPKAPPQARNALDQDPRLHEFRFHFSVTAIMQPWAAEIDTFNILDASTAQKKMRYMCQRLDAWASQFRIIPDGEGNRLELVTPTDNPSSLAHSSRTYREDVSFCICHSRMPCCFPWIRMVSAFPRAVLQ